MNKNLADILILSDKFELRGSCLQTLNLASELPRYGIDVQLLTTDASQIHPNRKRLLRMMVNPYLKYRLLDPVTMEFIASDFSDQLPDLIHIQTLNMHLLGKKLARRLKIPYILTLHSHIKPGESLYLDPQYGMGVICISKSVQDSLLNARGINLDSTTIITGGVKIPDHSDTNRLVKKSGIIVVGTAGPLEKNKGLTYLVQAAALVLNKTKQVQFLIAGAGPEEKTLRNLTRELKIHTSFTFVPDDYDLDHTLQAVDIFCLPSLEQGLGTIMLQAMAHGIPVIASRIGGVNSVVNDQVNGLLVPPRDSEEIAQAIFKLLDNPEITARIQQSGHDFVASEYPLESMVLKHSEYYKSAIEKFRLTQTAKSDSQTVKT